MSNFSDTLDRKIMPAMSKLSENKIIKSIQYGAMATMPLSLGVALIAIISNLPIAPWLNWLNATGIDLHMQATLKVTLESLGLYMTFIIGYYHAQQRSAVGITGGIMSLAAYLILMPHTISSEVGVVSGIDFDFLGANGIFGGMILALIISGLYAFMNKKGIVVKLPSSVPSKVAESMSPTFIAILIFTGVFLARVGLSFTAYENYFNMINTIIGTPILNLGANPTSAVIFMVLSSACWFFGIHPNVILSMFIPVLMTTGTANVNAFMSGEAMPYFAFTGAMMFYAFGGTGNTIGLSLMMPFVAKSERYKTLGKLNFGPALFNINEPLIFGLPVMLNPLFFVPLIGSSLVNGLMGITLYNLGFFNALNPTISLPWVMPVVVGHFIRIGLLGAVAALSIVLVDSLIYYPFFKKADKLALAEEQAEAAELEMKKQKEVVLQPAN
ncbi:PTS sugar transporter subunit IIC [Alkalibacterium pelagium]|uniref:Permease IIC component n=1 Tax=Alkalibacterium pelagium TaxID=426702 RepID=A0A1H7PV69_9LACT|nr:PTS transporter subunit EIIC [Alkalibacterium pelagium]GEN51716.1 permease IIC component [Alkalibacterium pelagium]SEL39145.1 PTS system, cellobiose-specific IIC component [Alkalibacterium pelagium]